MRIVLLLFILIPFFTFSQINQTDSNGLRQGLWKKQQPNGRLIYEGHFKDGKPIGEWKRYHEGGQVKAVINYRADSDSAFTQIFDKFGKKVSEGNYINQKKEGNWIYLSNKRKIAEEQFKNGMKNGISKKYYNTGELMEEMEYVDGNQEGNYEVFYKNGQPYMQCKMKQNMRHGLYVVNTDKGRRQMEAAYKNNLRHGDWKFYSESGELHYLLKYNEGELLNPEVKDSISNLRMQNFEKEKGKIVDPEDFLTDPTEYMRKLNIKGNNY